MLRRGTIPYMSAREAMRKAQELSGWVEMSTEIGPSPVSPLEAYSMDRYIHACRPGSGEFLCQSSAPMACDAQPGMITVRCEHTFAMLDSHQMLIYICGESFSMRIVIKIAEVSAHSRRARFTPSFFVLFSIKLYISTLDICRRSASAALSVGFSLLHALDIAASGPCTSSIKGV
jgi:hypothetical protein